MATEDTGCIVINETVWKKMSVEERDYALFTTLTSLNNRLSRLEKFRFWYGGLIFVGSSLGGAGMMLALVLLKIKVV